MPGVTRREILQTSVLLGSLGVSSCALGSPSTTKPTSSDLRLIRLFASVELAVISSYSALIEGLKSRRLGNAPPALLAFLAASIAHHQLHAENWNRILSQSNGAMQSNPNPTVDAGLKQDLAGVRQFPDMLKLANRSELTLAQTIGAGSSALADASLIDLAARTAAVEAQHAGVVRYLSGDELFTEDVVVNDYARPASDVGNG